MSYVENSAKATKGDADFDAEIVYTRDTDNNVTAIRWKLGDMKPGEKIVVIFKVTAPAVTEKSVWENRGYLHYDDPDDPDPQEPEDPKPSSTPGDPDDPSNTSDPGNTSDPNPSNPPDDPWTPSNKVEIEEEPAPAPTRRPVHPSSGGVPSSSFGTSTNPAPEVTPEAVVTPESEITPAPEVTPVPEITPVPAPEIIPEPEVTPEIMADAGATPDNPRYSEGEAEKETPKTGDDSMTGLWLLLALTMAVCAVWVFRRSSKDGQRS